MKQFGTLLIALAMLLVSCTTTASDETTTTTTTPTGGSDTTTTTAGSSESTTTSAVDTTTSTVESSSAGVAECVIGAWELEADSFFEQLMASMPPDEQVGEFAVVGGRYVLTVNSDGTFSNEREDWTLGVQSDFGDMEIRINSSQSGTYTLDGDQISTTVAAGEPPDVEILVDGQPMTLPGGVAPISPPAAEFSGATLACQGDELTATANDFTSTWKRAG